MTSVVNEPKAEYKIKSWQQASKENLFEESIFAIEDETFLIFFPAGSTYSVTSEKLRKNLSNLRGQLTKQTEKEIDDQISDLRSEWDRNI